MSPGSPRWADCREILRQLLAAAIELANPGPMVLGHLALTPGSLKAGGRMFPRKPESRIVVLSLGKAGAAMARAASSALGSALDQGLLVAPVIPPELPPRFRAIRGGHPLPDAGSLNGGQAARDLVLGLAPADFFLALVSGGGSASMEIPAPGIDLETLQEVERTLILGGARIEEINKVRSALSSLKRGGLARWAQPAQTIGLLLSDVTGDRPELIASGPTVPAPLPPAEVVEIVQRFHLERRLPASVFVALESASASPAVHPEPFNLVIGSNVGLAHSVANAAAGMGFEARVVATDITGEARLAGERIAASLIQTRASPVQHPLALIFGGETTVRVKGPGQGGRNQELALSAAIHLEGVERTALMAFGTDGVDGNSDAAGAVVLGDTCQRADRLGASPQEALEQNDSHGFFHRLGDCLHLGPSGTNLNDLVLALLFP